MENLLVLWETLEKGTKANTEQQRPVIPGLSILLNCERILITKKSAIRQWWYCQLISRRILVLCEIEPNGPYGKRA